MNEVLVAAGAEQDFTESLCWYAERSQRAADGFEAEFAAALEAIAAHPDRYPLCDDHHRYYLMKRYPLQVIYRRLSDDRLLIVAVAHASRRPSYWLGRPD